MTRLASCMATLKKGCNQQSSPMSVVTFWSGGQIPFNVLCIVPNAFSREAFGRDHWQETGPSEWKDIKIKRFVVQEPGAQQVITFPRQLGNSLRKPDDRRKKQRESHAQNKLAAKQEAETEVKRLKNLKKQELQER